jgi:signal peptidase
VKEKEIFKTFVILLVVVFLINALIPLFTGSEKFMIVLSGSMVPLFLPGDIIIVKLTDPNELNVGDVVSFQVQARTMFTHRVISISEGGSSTGEQIHFFQTKGDANNVQDDFKVPEFNTVGKLIFVIPFVGLLIDAFKNNKIILFVTVIIPACIIIIDEIKNALIYCNPRRARKVEHEQKKVARRTYSKIKGKQLLVLIPISGFIITGIVAFNMGENGPVVLESENKIDNPGFIPMVYVITPDNSEQMFDIKPWYGVIFKTNDSLITPQNVHVSQTNKMVIAPENTHAQISTAPYILPVFWITVLAGVNPYLPAVTEILIYTSIVTLIMKPFWHKESRRGRTKKRISFKRRLAQWKRIIHFSYSHLLI